ncbi:Long chronological lifespan protein 2 [Escovopsis weberi]|uniref:Long chronological lifespan protein 2 n=1 Tax=Escovopsis weberi TaxID=150374 RepID=A0A0M8MUS8_ESCWE|nr:Long chronological lifespan protein 2 [Escovopsis weberi]
MRLLIALLSLLSLAHAQFGFFDQMFSGQQQQQHQQPPSNPSDSSLYRARYDQYTLACVHFPHHCPCAWDAQQDKFELADGHRLCVSKGGFQAGEAARKVELARKGLL